MKKILVIEDNQQNMYLMQYMLEHSGYEVVIANTGAQAMDVAAQIKSDLILMDIQLPDIDGLEVTRRIRLLEEYATVPIIAVTSFAMVGDKQKALAAGCNGYIEKPINPETFLAEITKYI